MTATEVILYSYLGCMLAGANMVGLTVLWVWLDVYKARRK